MELGQENIHFCAARHQHETKTGHARVTYGYTAMNGCAGMIMKLS